MTKLSGLFSSSFEHITESFLVQLLRWKILTIASSFFNVTCCNNGVVNGDGVLIFHFDTF